MSRKSQLPPYHFVSSQALGASTFTSTPTNILYQDNVAIQLNATGTPTGTFAVQVSLDYVPNEVAGNWVALSLPTTPTLSGAANVINLDLNQLSAPWVRVVYTGTGGSGTLDGYIAGKQV